MPFIDDESKEKKESLFLKYEPENTLVLKSKLYKIPFHYLKDLNKSVYCHEKNDKGCVFCENGYDKRIEYNYFVLLNDQPAIMNIKPSVFFAIQAITRASKIKDEKPEEVEHRTRRISWLVIKSGQGLDTEYTVSKDSNLEREEFEKNLKELKTFNEKLGGIMKKREDILTQNYNEFKNTVTPQVKNNKPKREEEVEEPKGEATENVTPDDIPF